MKSYIKLLLLVCLVIILIKIFYIKVIEGFKYKSTNKNSDCDKKDCPISKNQNDIYKLHVDFKPVRDKNHMIANNTITGNFLSKMIGTKTGPENIFIIRHGEKVKTKDALDCNGILRSTYIPQLIENLNQEGFGINYIITAYDYNSMHQQQTVSLTSWLLSIPVFMYGDQTETEVTAKQLFTNSYFNGKTILICWEHGCIQTLLDNIIKIGVKAKGLHNYKFKNPKGNSDLPYWNTNNYKTIFHLDNQLNFNVSEEKFNTCFADDNNKIKYGKKQKCGSK